MSIKKIAAERGNQALKAGTLILGWLTSGDGDEALDRLEDEERASEEEEAITVESEPADDAVRPRRRGRVR